MPRTPLIHEVGIKSVNIELDDGSSMKWTPNCGVFLSYFEKSQVQRLVRHWNKINKRKEAITEPKPTI